MRGFVLWVSYVWLKTWAGLALHPYKSVKGMVYKDNVLLPVTVSPSLALLVFFVVGRFGSFMFELTGWRREVMAAALGTTLIGMFLWQGLIMVLVWRFYRGKHS